MVFEKSEERWDNLPEEGQYFPEIPFDCNENEEPKSKRLEERENGEKSDLYSGVREKTKNNDRSLLRHFRQNKNHVKNLQKSDSKYLCFLCQKNFNGKDATIEHLSSMAHEVMVAQNIFDYRFDRKMSESLDCSYCDFDATEIDEAIYHFLSEQHEKRMKNPEVSIDGTVIERSSNLGKSRDDSNSICPEDFFISPDSEESDKGTGPFLFFEPFQVSHRKFLFFFLAFRVRIAPKIIDADAFYFCSLCNLKIFGGKSHLLKHLKGFGHSATLRDPTFEMKIYLDYGMKPH